MKRTLYLLAAGMAVALVASACTSDSAPDELVLLTHDSFALSEGTLEAFTEETGITVIVQPAGDAGSMVNQAVLTKENPLGDVMYGIDNTFLSRAVSEGIFTPHTAADIDTVNPLLRIAGDTVTPIDFGDVCINYDIEALAAAGITPPASLADLSAPAYKDLLVVQDPATSSPGLSFLLATIAAYPDGAEYDWKAYWTDLFTNGVSVASDWTEAYSSTFTMAGGDRPLVVSYASSPPAEVLFGELSAAPTAIMTDGCSRQIEYAGVLAGTPNEESAGQLVDFLLSVAVQEDIPLNMFVYPTNMDAELPEVFVTYTTFPEAPVIMEPNTVEQNRERWIQEWTEIARSAG
ncbi:MAG: thiamine ABC transporter substrate-binding protein [Acidimicrobiia bacterium]